MDLYSLPTYYFIKILLLYIILTYIHSILFQRQIFTNIATNKNTNQEITKVEMYILLDFLFDTPEEASAYTGPKLFY